jgi:hypothetical protein
MVLSCILMDCEFVVRENSAGDGATFNRSISGDTANAVSNDPFIVFAYENFKGMMIEYVIYNANETRKRIGTFTLIWNSQSISATPTANDSVSYELWNNHCWQCCAWRCTSGKPDSRSPFQYKR